MDWRNPFENFRDKYISFKRVKAYKLWVFRHKYIPYSPDKIVDYKMKIKQIWGDEISEEEINKFMPEWKTYRNMGVKNGIQPWITKFFNAKFSIHLGCIVAVDEQGEQLLCPILRVYMGAPFIGIVYRWNEENYFQCGGFFGPDYEPDKDGVYEIATICGKFRFANFKKEYLTGGNYDVYGYYEGIC